LKVVPGRKQGEKRGRNGNEKEVAKLFEAERGEAERERELE
jgi:hypothetical protein